MSVGIDEMKRLRDMMTQFLYAIHGYGVLDIDFTSVKKEQEKTKIQGSFKVRTEEFSFVAEFDRDGRLLSYERVKSGVKS